MKRLCYLLLISALTFPALPAKEHEWKDVRGATFRGDAIEAIGPLALFRVGKHDGRLIPFSALPAEECVQFYQESKETPPRATDWAQTKSELGFDVVHHGPNRLKNDALVEAKFAGQPEPLFYVVVYVSNGESRTWDLLGKVVPMYNEIHPRYPEEFEAILFGIGNSAGDHKNMAVSMKVPWLVTNVYDQANLPILRTFAPVESKGGLIVFSRSGVPLFGRDIDDADHVTEPMTQLGAALDAIRPDNPKGWKDRAYYLRAIQPVAFATGHSDPVLVGNPLRADGLRQRKVYLVDATIAVSADGHVTSVAVTPDEKNLPAAMAAPLGDALKKATLFVPAVQDGKFVDGTYHYRLEVPH